jgi:hypothetical protein
LETSQLPLNQRRVGVAVLQQQKAHVPSFGCA